MTYIQQVACAKNHKYVDGSYTVSTNGDGKQYRRCNECKRLNAARDRKKKGAAKPRQLPKSLDQIHAPLTTPDEPLAVLSLIGRHLPTEAWAEVAHMLAVA